MTAGTVCVSVAAGKPTANWLTWRCRADCSKTVLLRLNHLPDIGQNTCFLYY